MKPLIVALDVDTEKEALRLVKATKKHVDIFKIGPTLVLRYGPSIIKKIRAQRKKIFLDLKFHDIPNTMLRSIKEAGALGGGISGSGPSVFMLSKDLKTAQQVEVAMNEVYGKIGVDFHTHVSVISQQGVQVKTKKG